MLSTIFNNGECPSVREVFTEQRRQVRRYLNDITFRPAWRLSNLAASTVVFRLPRTLDALQWRANCRGPFVTIKPLREVLHAGGCQVYGPRFPLP